MFWKTFENSLFLYFLNDLICTIRFSSSCRSNSFSLFLDRYFYVPTLYFIDCFNTAFEWQLCYKNEIYIDKYISNGPRLYLLKIHWSDISCAHSQFLKHGGRILSHFLYAPLPLCNLKYVWICWIMWSNTWTIWITLVSKLTLWSNNKTRVNIKKTSCFKWLSKLVHPLPLAEKTEHF